MILKIKMINNFILQKIKIVNLSNLLNHLNPFLLISIYES